MIAVSEDVTERRELEARLLQSQKLESIGRLAGGVAHDFNNLLTVFSLSSELLLLETGLSRNGVPSSPTSGKLRVAAPHLPGSFSFSRQDILEPRVLDLADLVDDSLRLLRRLIQESIQLTHLRRDPARVRVDPGQWGQVLVNLVVNARDAMPAGGRLRLETGCLVQSGDDARFPDAPHGTYALLSIEDTGAGMSPEVRETHLRALLHDQAATSGDGARARGGVRHRQTAGGHIHVRSEPGRAPRSASWCR